MSLDKAARFVEALLNQEKLSYKMVHNKNSIAFDNLSIGEGAVIILIQRSIYLLINLKRKSEIKEMDALCKSFERRFKSVKYIFLKNGNGITLRLRIPIAERANFKVILVEIDSELQGELFPFSLNIITKEPNTYFVKQYRLWKSISPLEQSGMIEDILVLKERYFRTTKTEKGIINKLNKVKKELSSACKGQNGRETKYTLTGSYGNVYYEFYMVDFAALFRAIELGLVMLKVEDFFENYKIRRNK